MCGGVPLHAGAQTAKCFADLGRYVSPAVSVATLVGGGDPRAALARGADVVVGTCGMLDSLVRSGALDARDVRFLVVDEADALCERESLEVIMRLHALFATAAEPGGGVGARLQVCARMAMCNRVFGRMHIRIRGVAQVMLFSATLHSPAIAMLSGAITAHPTWVRVWGRVNSCDVMGLGAPDLSACLLVLGAM